MLSVVVIFNQSPGQYDHYFSTFIQGRDVGLSMVKIVIFAFAITLLHCWYGFKLHGGPQSVGEATTSPARSRLADQLRSARGP